MGKLKGGSEYSFYILFVKSSLNYAIVMSDGSEKILLSTLRWKYFIIIFEFWRMTIEAYSSN
jgi:hypothetical protein